ncbi:hypothetical protein POREN0001_1983 [Porphyromonas endodontalis ATCC 35406]|uniref:Uncharacterized protein n=1 Tax=Porphyromonas endodontalis (strain ATCC 35406 / DSM 24491 / JCM 8526 / CCUG 16442 / BCRC 14492 / NCTC 13058 / HG 370) TaxID=553175 RepID=C3JCW2_POREA|nr:hypothetical protein POREN0001_1983 [Porphyromonas endodontalis ATCC 35406]
MATIRAFRPPIQWREKAPFTLESGMKNDSKVKGLNIDD